MLQDRFRARFRTLPDWEQAYLMGALERVAAMLDAEDIEPDPVPGPPAVTPVRRAR